MRQFLLLALLLPLSALAASDSAGETKYYTAETTGQVSIDTEGHVTAVEVKPRQLGNEISDIVADQIRVWRFRPVIENGQPVAATYRMRLSLVAAQAPGDDGGMGVAVREVQFVQPHRNGVQGERMLPPAYPAGSGQDGVSGQVMLLIRLGENGHVADAGAMHVLLYGELKPYSALNASYVRRFVDASLTAAKDWTFIGAAGELVRVPINFRTHGSTSDKWRRTRVFAVRRPAWMDAALAERTDVGIRMAGLDVDIDEQAVLLTKTSDALMPGGDG